ncbi:TrbG/VirB9 family P-type conjugative transfer protein [Klebsiella oxytoca]|uniref:TrbG/VirB9 family P-type conjugative transfer protein n=1 Tax=Klebsiella oxytoca TaxID=571 RepID=UPI00254E05DA|nr:TrbG/VirB9 family P-type conjugative transfer protein [Klebsiella oxytoca]MEC5509929.1 TrbG/VirB9 family P-type conjugative transfer protein [Klebsiella oxytoca]
MKNTLFLALLVVSVASHAAVAPKSTRYDRQVQTVLYNPDDVVRVKIGTGAATLIQFEAGENLKASASGLGIGDPDAWDLAIRENNLFLRPKAPQPDTNISLVTNRRTYVLKLETSEQPTWLLRFTYPVEPRSPFNNNPLPCRSTDILNQAWLARGDSGLLPMHVWADGRFTCMKFYGGQELPVVYRVMPSTKAPERGTETLVNQHMQDDVMVIKETGDYFRLRMGDRVAGVSTTTLQRAGYNASGTTTGQQRTLVKGDKKYGE